ncbi:MAG: DUF4258 domain-containing protein [Candidatus Omnitrophota bacterium]
MKYTLTKHAEKVLKEREIPLEYVERALNDPEWIEPDRDDPELEHRLRRMPEYGNRALRVVLNRNAEPANIVTVYYDRKMRGKL